MQPIDVLAVAKAMQDEMAENRRALHQIPEVGCDLPQTTAFILQKLREMGYTPREATPFGVVAEAGQGAKTLLLRADMDALPLQEESGLPFAADKNLEACHACGHDLHMAMLLGAAKIIKENEALCPGKVRLMFQPGEEGLAGAQAMIDGSILENPKISAAFGLHVMPGKMEPGQIALSPGYVMASQDRFRLTVTGLGGHGAKPEQTVDPITAAAHVHLGLQSILAREISAKDQAVVTVGSFLAGSAPNIIPEKAVMEGTVRTFNPDVRAFVKSRMESLCPLLAQSFRADCKVEFYGETPAVFNDSALAAQGEDALRKQGFAVENQEAEMVSEDFAAIAAKVPSIFLFLGAGGEGFARHLHDPAVRFNEEALPFGAAALATLALDGFWAKGG